MQEQSIEGVKLSIQQMSQWALREQREALYARCVLTLDGRVDIERLKSAISKLAKKHEILRTTFHSRPGVRLVVQAVSDHMEPQWREIDLSELSEDRRLDRTLEILQSEIRIQSDYHRGPMVRVTLLRLSTHKHRLVITLPSLCADRRTMNCMTRLIAGLYAAEFGDATEEEEPLQYAQFCEWQHELLESEESNNGKDYWRRQVQVATPQPRLPLERKQPKQVRFDPAELSIKVDADSTTRLEELSERAGASIEEVLLAAWQTLLWKLTGETKIYIATLFDGRKHDELREALGLFARFIPLQSHFNPAFRFAEIIEQVQDAMRGAYEWQDYYDLEEGSQQPDRLGACIAFEVESRSPDQLAAGVRFSVSNEYICLYPFKLNLSCAKTQDGLWTEFHYDLNFFKRGDIDRLADQYHTLLKSVAGGFDASIAGLNILSESHRRRLLFEFNAARGELREKKMFHEQFEEQARRSPWNPAIVYENEQITYADLNARSNQLARCLKRAGVGPESIVALCIERSVESIVTMLAILKAGGAYATLDAHYPDRRLALMLEDLKMPILVTNSRLSKEIERMASKVVRLDEDWEIISQEESGSVATELGNANLMYVTFTSGSTGRPKGVAVEHEQVINYIQGVSDRLALPSGAKYATVSTFAADLGNTMIFPSLITGGCLHIISEERAADPEMFADYMFANKIECLKIVPSQLSALLSGSRPERVIPSDRLILGGEALRWELVDKIKSLNHTCRIFNHYGPTETTVGVLTYPVSGDQDDYPSAVISLGKPIPNIQAYVFDGNRQIAPIGVSGELRIGGASVTRGYYNRSELTAEVFLPDPFSHEPGMRMYSTGDLVTYRPDGNIEFHGRIDNQVKFHGYRVELNEIRSALNFHPNVRDSVVTLTKDRNGNSVMIAYYVSRAELDSGELRAFLSESIIEDTLPNLFVHLKNLPLTLNGKINYSALPDFVETDQKMKRIVGPRTPVEDLVMTIWSQLLTTDRISLHDNFFELGGHSLLATQVISRLREAFQVEIPLRYLFESPTVLGLAEKIERSLRNGAGPVLPPLKPVPRDACLPLSFAQQRLWFLDQMESGNSAYNISGAVRLKGELHVAALEKSINEIIRRHETLRTRFKLVAGQPVQIVERRLTVSVEREDISHLDRAAREEEVERIAKSEDQKSFDLEKAPLLRTKIIKIDEREHALVVTMHHIVSDGWSIGVFVREMAALYDSIRNGRPSPLRELDIQYGDYTIWQRDWLKEDVLRRELAYWRKQLAGLPALNLATNKPRPAARSYSGASYSMRLSSTLAESLKGLARQEGVTLFMLLLAAFQTLLHRLTGQTDIVVGTDIANRNSVEVERLISFFVNQLVLRSDFSGNPSFRDLLRRVRETSLAAYSHQDLPFDKLVAALRPERSLGYTPLFQVLFVLQNAPASTIEISGLTIIPLEIKTTSSKFDLGLFMHETPQGLQAIWRYSTELFEPDSIARMANSFQRALETILADIEVKVGAVELLSDSEKSLVKMRREEEKNARIDLLRRVRREIVDLSDAPVAEMSR